MSSKDGGLRRAQGQVMQFHEAAGQPHPTTPRRLRDERLRLRAKWMSEEIEELRDAATLVDQVDAVVDLIYFALGTLVEMGVDGQEAFDIVHRANMAKLMSVRVQDSDGKVEKPAGWISPEALISAAIARQAAGVELFTAPDDTACLGATLATIAPLVDAVFVGGGVSLPSLRSFVESNGLQLEVVDHSQIDEATFHTAIDELIETCRAVLVEFDPSFLVDDAEPHMHYCVVVVRDGSSVMVLDPGPPEAGLRELNIDRLFAGMRHAGGSLYGVR